MSVLLHSLSNVLRSHEKLCIHSQNFELFASKRKLFFFLQSNFFQTFAILLLDTLISLCNYLQYAETRFLIQDLHAFCLAV